VLLSVAEAVDNPKDAGLGIGKTAVLSGEVQAFLEADRMSLLRIQDVDLALNQARFEEHFAGVLEMEQCLRYSAVFGEPVECF
jgi:hypothetical protein